MHRWSDLSQTPPELRGGVATFGNFDGVHRGHRAVLSAVLDAAAAREVPSVAVTFEPHPVAVFHPERELELIAPGVLRDELLGQTGIDGLLVLDFTRELADQSAVEFVERTFVKALGVRVLVVGEDTKGFGRGYAGDVHLLRELAEQHGFELIVLQDLGEGGRWSSSRVRQLLTAGDVAGAATVLGRPHRVVGPVVHGEHRGRELGYPTANLGPESLGLVPADGVYAGWLTRLELPIEDPLRTLPAAICVGLNPTFDDVKRRTVEAHVLDRDDLDLYGEQVAVELVERVRDNERFESVAELLAAMAGDVERCRQVLRSVVPG